MEAKENGSGTKDQKPQSRYPPPPEYWKKFENSSKDMKKPDLKLLKGKGYTLQFNGAQTHFQNVNLIPNIID